MLRCGKRLRIPIERDDPAARPKSCQYFATVSATTEGCINVDSIGFDIQRVDSLPEQYRLVRALTHGVNEREPGLTMATLASCESQCEVLHPCRQLARLGLDLIELSIPGFLAPQFEMAALANEHQLLFQTGEFAKRWRNKQPARAVKLKLFCKADK